MKAFRSTSRSPSRFWPGGSFVVLAAAMLAAAVGVGCRPNTPLPPDAGQGGGSPMTGGTTGTGGRAGTGGSAAMTGGGGGSVDPPDTAPPIDTAPPCGNANQSCCPGNTCLEGGCCEFGVCTQHGSACKTGGTASCVSGRCGGECGGGLSPKCCLARTCTLPLKVCDNSPGAGLCVDCGGKGQLCCGDKYCAGGIKCGADNHCGAATPPDGGTADTAAPPDAPMDAPKG